MPLFLKILKAGKGRRFIREKVFPALVTKRVNTIYMTTTFHISTEELNDEFLQRLKNTFGKKQLLITVEEDDSDTFYLLSTQQNRDKFKQSLQELKNGEVVSVSLEDLRK